eukprot:Hpha_TRINITY_DN16209_c1_g6::TRINITY_DN16209_c1_g6_i1::g.13902::m.13902/K02150/ATPeV1E, ATP6E; V-type H+-transporting ATPase subunit E
MPDAGESVRRQVEQMSTFIIEEAREKALEVEYRAASEAEAKKQEDARKAAEKKDAEVKKELDQARMRLRVEHAKLKKADDDKVLQHRVDAVECVRDASVQRLKSILDGSDYPQLLQQLTVQSAFALEGHADVRCRPEDRSKIDLQKAQIAAGELLRRVGRPRDIKLEWEQKELTDAEKAALELGGVYLTLQGGTPITCDNTLVSRLGTCIEEYAPVLRHALFQV